MFLRPLRCAAWGREPPCAHELQARARGRQDQPRTPCRPLSRCLEGDHGAVTGSACPTDTRSVFSTSSRTEPPGGRAGLPRSRRRVQPGKPLCGVSPGPTSSPLPAASSTSALALGRPVGTECPQLLVTAFLFSLTFSGPTGEPSWGKLALFKSFLSLLDSSHYPELPILKASGVGLLSRKWKFVHLECICPFPGLLLTCFQPAFLKKNPDSLINPHLRTFPSIFR